MRGFADERQSRGDIGFRDHQREWVRPTPPDWLDGAKEVPEPDGEFLCERALAELHYPRRKFGSFRPHDRRAVSGHWQDGERARRQEMLDGDAAMRPLVPHR